MRRAREGRSDGNGAWSQGYPVFLGRAVGGGAAAHLVRASRSGARMRPTFDGGQQGRGCHCSPCRSGRTFCPRHPAIDPGDTWGVGHGTGNGLSTRGGSDRSIPDPVYDPSNWSSANRPGDRRGGSSHRIHQRHGRPPVSGGDLRVSGRSPQAVWPRRSGVAWRRRITPRRSRSFWTTRAALTRSGSWLTVPATQSMYDGSKAAIWPSV